jgi:hypothetical protein
VKELWVWMLITQVAFQVRVFSGYPNLFHLSLNIQQQIRNSYLLT